MYEKNGLMVKLTDPRCIEYVRRGAEPSSRVVESALLRKLGLEARTKRVCRRRHKKKHANVSSFPVKIMDERVINHILEQRSRGVVHRYTVERALLDVIEKSEKGGAL